MFYLNVGVGKLHGSTPRPTPVLKVHKRNSYPRIFRFDFPSCAPVPACLPARRASRFPLRFFWGNFLALEEEGPFELYKKIYMSRREAITIVYFCTNDAIYRVALTTTTMTYATFTSFVFRLRATTSWFIVHLLRCI
jgi:hypothetical protein